MTLRYHHAPDICLTKPMRKMEVLAVSYGRFNRFGLLEDIKEDEPSLRSKDRRSLQVKVVSEPDFRRSSPFLIQLPRSK
jgi:hypothetical protein